MKIHHPFRTAFVATLGVGLGLVLIGSIQTLSTILLYIGTALFLSLGHHEALVRRLSAAFEERRKRLVHAISAFLPEWRATDSAGGTSLWLEGPRGIDARALAAQAAARSVIIEPGDRFFDRTDKPARFMRLGISSIALQHIEPGIRELATAAGRRPAAA